jgi:capsular polysaccharide biosynthesis protein
MPTIVDRPLEDLPPTVPGDEAGLPTPTRLTHHLFKPGWPLAAVLVPFPLWWVLGVSEWVVPAMVLPMALHLLRQRSVLVPRGFGWWMAFLLWVFAGGFLLQVDALGAVADNSSTRLVTFGYRVVWYVSITVVLIYVVNTRRQLSTTRIIRMVACLFVTVTLGGVLGVVAPYFEFKSVAELLLPGSLTKFQLIRSMVHPQAAQLQLVLGYAAPRPSAPFTFTNTWGLNFAVTLPFFLWAWLGRDAGWRRWAAGPILLVAAVPFIYSLNRGLWGACIAMALFVAVRAALTGRPGVLAGIVAGAAALAMLLAVSPLGDIVALRFSNKGSEEGRTNLGTLAIRSVTATSPIVGLGSTRNVQGNFQSITGGSTAQCPRCSPPSLGTQGQLWLVVFSQGLAGLALFLMFFARIFLRHIRLRAPEATVALAAVVAWGVTLPVYNSLGTGMLIVMIAVGLLCREGAVDTGTGSLPGADDPSLRSFEHYVAALKGGLPVIAVMTVLGLSLGALWQLAQPSPHKATASVLLSEPPRYPSPGYARTNVDTDGQLVASKTVRDAAVRASGQSPSEIAEHLTVTATPNTRVLHLHLTAPTAAAAEAGVDAATDAFLDGRTARLEADRVAELAKLRGTALTLAAAINVLNDEVQTGGKRRDSSRIVDPASAVARDHRNELLPRSDAAARQSARIAGLVLSGGHRTAATVVTQSSDRWRVDLISGATAGLALGALLALLWSAAGPRLKRVKDIEGSAGLPLLAEVPGAPDDVRSLAHLFVDRPMAYVAATEGDAVASSMADRLTDRTRRPRNGGGAVIIASSRTRLDQVLACRHRLQLQDIPVRGLVVVTQRQRLRGATAHRPSDSTPEGLPPGYSRSDATSAPRKVT